MARSDRKIPPQRAFRDFGPWPHRTGKFLWALPAGILVRDRTGQENSSGLCPPEFWSVTGRDGKIPLHFVRRDFVSLAILYFCLVRCQKITSREPITTPMARSLPRESFSGAFFQKGAVWNSARKRAKRNCPTVCGAAPFLYGFYSAKARVSQASAMSRAR